MTKVLDHGYVKLIDFWGSDEAVITAARMSTHKGFIRWGPYCCDAHPSCGHELKPGDEKLLRYLWENKHHTPFEMAGMTVEVKAPIFVFRQWHRHRTMSYNEMSARYTAVPDEHYIPTVERLMASGHHKQDKGSCSRVHAIRFREALIQQCQKQETLYQDALNVGVPKELARCAMPVNRYSVMQVSANMRNWLHFMSLRLDKHAQWEIRQFAWSTSRFIQEKMRRTWELFNGI